jgi:hypothetical protein
MLIISPPASPHKYPHPDDWMYEDPEILLQEMASPPDVVQTNLTKYDGSLCSHLLKLFYFRDFQEYFNNWSNTVYKCAFRVSKLSSPPKYKNKWPSADLIYKWMWGDPWEDIFDTLHAGFVKDVNNKSNPEYQYLPYIHQGGDEQQAASFIKDYHLWLARRLSKDGKVSLSDVRDEIKLLFRKYPV